MVLSCHQAFHAISHKESEVPSIMSAHNQPSLKKKKQQAFEVRGHSLRAACGYFIKKMEYLNNTGGKEK